MFKSRLVQSRCQKRGEVCNILLPNFKIVERSSASDSDRASAYYQLHSQIKDLGEEVGEGGGVEQLHTPEEPLPITDDSHQKFRTFQSCPNSFHLFIFYICHHLPRKKRKKPKITTKKLNISLLSCVKIFFS